MSITNYSYVITSVVPEAATMEITYAADGLPDVVVGARLPYADESIEAVVAMYAPLAYWEQMQRDYRVVCLGAAGNMDVAATVTLLNPQPQQATAIAQPTGIETL